MQITRHKILSLFALAAYSFSGIVGATHIHALAGASVGELVATTPANAHGEHGEHECGLCVQIASQSMPLVPHQANVEAHLSCSPIVHVFAVDVFLLFFSNTISLRAPPVC